MKEQVYAWFPSASEIQRTQHKDPDSYTKECLYRFEKSRYREKIAENVASEWRKESEVRTERSTSNDEGMTAKVSRPMTSMYPHPPSTTPTIRSRSVAAEDRNQWTAPKGGGGSTHALASRDWQGRLAGTSTTTVFPDGRSQEPSVQPNPEVRSGRSRAQSAVFQRPTVPLVRRSIQSAFPLTTTSGCSGSVVVSDQQKERSEEAEVSRSRGPPSRPRGPTPHRWKEEVEQVEEKGGGGGGEASDYDHQLKTHGWKMEIPGDPLRIKRSCIGKRLATTVVVPMPTSHLRSNGCQNQSNETFFYNTVPRIPLSFIIHPDWASEVLRGRGAQLRARQGRVTPGTEGVGFGQWNDWKSFVRHSDFSFVY